MTVENDDAVKARTAAKAWFGGPDPQADKAHHTFRNSAQNLRQILGGYKVLYDWGRVTILEIQTAGDVSYTTCVLR
jgi:hypothetical protein